MNLKPCNSGLSELLLEFLQGGLKRLFDHGVLRDPLKYTATPPQDKAVADVDLGNGLINVLHQQHFALAMHVPYVTFLNLKISTAKPLRHKLSCILVR